MVVGEGLRDVTSALTPADDPGSPLEPLTVQLGSHRLVVQRTVEGGTLRLVSGDGGEPLEIEVTAAGPILRLRSPLTVALEGGLSIDAETIALRSRGDLLLSSGADLVLRASDGIKSSGATQDIRATLGDVRVSANDDVAVNGERIKLNS